MLITECYIIKHLLLSYVVTSNQHIWLYFIQSVIFLSFVQRPTGKKYWKITDTLTSSTHEEILSPHKQTYLK